MSLKTPQSHSIRELEGLRGLLAVIVLFSHWGRTLTYSLAPLPQDLSGTEAVDVFIILSGFVISVLLSREDAGYRSYIIRRWFRIWPTFIVVILLCMAFLEPTRHILLESIHTATRDKRLLMIEDARKFLPWHFLSHLTLLHGFVPLTVDPYASYTLIGQGWSIGLEWQFYLLAPLFYYGVRRKRLFGKMLVLLVIAALVAPRHYFPFAYIGNKIGYLALGYVSFRVWSWYAIHGHRYSLRLTRLSCAAAVLAAAALHSYVSLGVAEWLVVFLTTLLSRRPDAHIEKRCGAFLLSRPLQFLGAISYTLYLVHFQIMILVLGLLGVEATTSIGMSLVLLLLTAIASIGAAMLISRYIERPGMAWGKKLSQKRRE